jgi:hypothetical protein
MEGLYMDKTKCKAIVPVVTRENENTEASFAKYRKKRSSHIFFVRMYLVFFFVGACVFACGKWDATALSQNAVSFISHDSQSVPDFCISFAPLILLSFVVFASGFTFYAPLVTFIYSAVIFMFCGICCSSIVYIFGISWGAFASIIILGINCILCVLFCSATCGISKITLNGVDKLSISDGLMYSALFFAVVCAWYLSGKGIFFLTPVN